MKICRSQHRARTRCRGPARLSCLHCSTPCGQAKVGTPAVLGATCSFKLARCRAALMLVQSLLQFWQNFRRSCPSPEVIGCWSPVPPTFWRKARRARGRHGSKKHFHGLPPHSATGSLQLHPGAHVSGSVRTAAKKPHIAASRCELSCVQTTDAGLIFLCNAAAVGSEALCC